MLVIISDLHLTDGTSGETIKPHAFKIFRERLRDAAYEASWRKDGRYRPLEELHLLLLGDILDVIRSTKWLEGPVRPWDDPQSPAFVARVKQINAAILKRNKDSLAVLKSLNDGKTTTLPPAVRGKPKKKIPYEPWAPARVPVRVKIHYLVGNHDWFYHLRGSAYDQIRHSVINAIGLANLPDQPFPHDPAESSAIQKIFAEHNVFARHGDIYDKFNYEKERGRDASSLGDAIVIELLNRFPQEVKRRLGRVLPKECLKGLKEIDNVRPVLLAPVWINGLLRRTCPDRKQADEVKAVWDELAGAFVRLPFVRERDTWLFDNVDKLEWVLKFSRGVSLGTLSRAVSWVTERMVSPDAPFHPNAFEEPSFRNRSARFIVYGHTHHHEIVPLDAVAQPGGILNQFYVNTGTWRRVHERAKRHPEEQEFMGYHVMTYAAFFQGDERAGRSFETWSGALGVSS